MIYSQKRKVGASLCGTQATLSLTGALSLIEDSLTELTAKLAIDGLTAMNQYHAIIVFVKNHIRFFDTAKWNDEIIVESFVSVKKRITFCIDTCIYHADRKLIACSRIELCGIDKDTGHLRKIETIGVDDHVEVIPPAVEISFFRPQPHTLSHCETVKVKTCNIDYVHHTNNIEYIKFILNTRSVAETEEFPIDEMEISYKNQSFEGDMLDIYMEKSEHALYYEIKKQDLSLLQCEMRLK